MDGKIVLRVVSGLVLLAAIAGIAFFAFNAGVNQGVLTKLPAAQVQPGTMPMPYYGMPPYWGAFPFMGFGFGCFGPLLALFLVFAAFRAMRVLFWGPGWGHMHGGHWRRGWGEEGVPPKFQEWHDQAHGKPAAEKKD